ncbi:MAG: YciI family protein [Acetobacteraceae bacterium]
MKYILLIHVDEKAYQAASQPEAERRLAGYMTYAAALVQAGAMVAGDRLQPTASASTVRVTAGKTQVLDGPYAETKEQLGGYFIIDVPDLDAALSWAARCPGASDGAIEVRPIWQM